eukprot:COSAG01_NODE_2570_length_7441_cov_2.829202_9_plen_57_part_00
MKWRNVWSTAVIGTSRFQYNVCRGTNVTLMSSLFTCHHHTHLHAIMPGADSYGGAG